MKFGGVETVLEERTGRETRDARGVGFIADPVGGNDGEASSSARLVGDTTALEPLVLPPDVPRSIAQLCTGGCSLISSNPLTMGLNAGANGDTSGAAGGMGGIDSGEDVRSRIS